MQTTKGNESGRSSNNQFFAKQKAQKSWCKAGHPPAAIEWRHEIMRDSNRHKHCYWDWCTNEAYTATCKEAKQGEDHECVARDGVH